MILHFETLKLHNFGSYADAEVSLTDRGFCLVSGKNLCKQDNAVSNGSGKSTIGSAICYALTGETISGLTSNLKNINIEANECWVELTFKADNDTYTITRIYKPKSDLMLIRNNENISGKGIRESEKILAEYLPDLTKDLIASTLILGQGMPNKFSSFSPSGRKELLEKLTKSDFMIEDLKTRLINRQTLLQENLQEYNSSILVNQTNLTNIQVNLANIESELIAPVTNFEAEIAIRNKNIADISEQIKVKNAELTAAEAQLEKTNGILLEKTAKKAEKLNLENKQYTENTSSLNMEQYKLTVDINQLQTEVNKLKQIKDICPTCGQKLPNVTKPDTSRQESEIVRLTESLSTIKTNLKQAETIHNANIAEINNVYNTENTGLQQLIIESKTKINTVKNEIAVFNTKLNSENALLAQLTFTKENYFKRRDLLLKQKEELQAKINNNKNAISLATTAKLDAEAHIAVLKKMDTLVKRDFRGYLLLDIINYLDAKAKEYCQIVFGTTELTLQLSGNALDITYCGKMFDSLSGGEKQRCDLILQFAIRDLLQNYLNYSSNILVLDEIFDGCDKQSTTKIIDLITTELKDIESIFIISHHADELNIPVDSEIAIVKNENGISEIVN